MAAFDNLKEPVPKNHFTIGIQDDVAHTSLDYDKFPLGQPGLSRFERSGCKLQSRAIVNLAARCDNVWSTAFKFICTISVPFFS
jgi:hypothetical protein